MENTIKNDKERMKLWYHSVMIISVFQGNIERFHFNPIPLNEHSRKFFPNTETFHIYNENDKIFNDGKIFKYVIWYTIGYSRYLQEKEE
ncbi:hypothetical protein EDI_199320 [Entamoeba dispar SAW760]|uniref:Uncharacterized protein n=1 Tax=Entamoeba dispar (strain ATCC PRA-260 / SAW760) TaxID=370354 RepID=B0EN18_ENTDS|nr:uncharacterized protein EDI_199320 [Entamoeba dispar SAW760]EDR24142.1 hypothetical protein EDI_199320 [Entamoeba dispar SAW760]|eukprot:EDR24142.1 hypothetical protein EDI_199320 [Entamoeba dispar SAW760]